MPNVIYVQKNGKMVRVQPVDRPDLVNFVIQWCGQDWSGFRTLVECEKQFAELEARTDATDDRFTVVCK